MKNPPLLNFLAPPFGAEYAWRPTWGFWERSYIRLFGLVDLPNRLRFRIVLPELDRLGPNRVLDLGSGTGCYCFYLSRKDRTGITGVEISERRISESSHIAKCLGRRNLNFYWGSAEDGLKSFPSEAFDLALAIEVLQYLADVDSVLLESYRVLKPGGYLLGHVPVLGYLRPEEKTLFADDKIQEMLRVSHFQTVKIRPTFGGMDRRLCSLYDRLSRRRMLMGALFPFILAASRVFPLETQNGDYRFFVARKPSNAQTGERAVSDK